MTKYLTDERFIVHSNTKEAQQNYRDNYDRIFGEKPDDTDWTSEGEPKTDGEVLIAISEQMFGKAIGTPKPDGDAIEAKLKCYANLIVPLEAQRPVDDRDHEPDCESLCTEGAACNCGNLYDE